jgi:hypothetical protein
MHQVTHDPHELPGERVASSRGQASAVVRHDLDATGGYLTA